MDTFIHPFATTNVEYQRQSPAQLELAEVYRKSHRSDHLYREVDLVDDVAPRSSSTHTTHIA